MTLNSPNRLFSFILARVEGCKPKSVSMIPNFAKHLYSSQLWFHDCKIFELTFLVFFSDAESMQVRVNNSRYCQVPFLLLSCRWGWYPCQLRVHNCKDSQTTFLKPIIKRMKDVNQFLSRCFKMIHFLQIGGGDGSQQMLG